MSDLVLDPPDLSGLSGDGSGGGQLQEERTSTDTPCLEPSQRNHDEDGNIYPVVNADAPEAVVIDDASHTMELESKFAFACDPSGSDSVPGSPTSVGDDGDDDEHENQRLLTKEVRQW